MRQQLESHIRSQWSEVVVEANVQTHSANSLPVLKIVSESSSNLTPPPNGQTVEVQSRRPLQEALFQIDAKLARMTRAIEPESPSTFSRKPVMSRRDFLFGFLGSRQASDTPVILTSRCEAKFGCSKCVDACPVPNALKNDNDSIIISGEHCVRCGLCAGVCPVGAIQIPDFSDDAYRELLKRISSLSAPKKTLVVTCNRQSVPSRPWMDVEEVRGIGAIGLRHLAIAANSGICALIIYCPDGFCKAKDQTKLAVSSISNLLGAEGPALAYLEGNPDQIEQIIKEAQETNRSPVSTTFPWKDYIKSLNAITGGTLSASGLGLTRLDVADSCTLCEGCVKSCPHGALTIQETELIFQTSECTGCGYCAEICPEQSITLHGMDGIVSLASSVVYRDELVKCARCHAPFASAKLLKKVSEVVKGDTLNLCSKCRQDLVYEKLFGSSVTGRE